MKKPRLLILTSTFPKRKADTEPQFVYNLCTYLTNSFEVEVLVPHAESLPIIEIMDDIKITRFRYAPISWQNLAYNGGILSSLKQNHWRYFLLPFFLLFQFFSLTRFLYKNPVDIVNAHWLVPQGAIAVLALKLVNFLFSRKPKLVITSHGSDLQALTGFFWRIIQRWTINSADSIIVVSSSLKSTAESLGINKNVSVIPMGVDLKKRFYPEHSVDRNPYKLLFVGRLVASKGIWRLFHAMRIIAEKSTTKISLNVVGDGPEKPALTEFITQHNLQEKIEFLGSVNNNDLPNIYRHSAVLILPSLHEGLGLVVIEALGCGCQIITSDLPVFKELLPAECCISGTAPESLANKILELTTGSSNKIPLDNIDINQFDWSQISQKYKHHLQTLLVS